MSDKQPPKLEGFSGDDYFGRPEYDPERVARLETGLYNHITEYADSLLVANNCSELIASDSPSVVYDSQRRTISRILARYDYNSSPFGGDGLPVETRINLHYQDCIEASQPTTYRIEVQKTQETRLDSACGFSVLYQFSRYGNSGFVDAEVIYPDVVNDSYAKRAMTPYDEKNLHDELALMATYVQLAEERDDSQLAND